MSPGELAERVLDRYRLQSRDTFVDKGVFLAICEEAIAGAIRAEREACAQVAERCDTGQAAASAIRDRSQ